MMSPNVQPPQSAPDDGLIKHLEFIQAIIARLSGNSFLLKAWSITLVAGLFALAAKDANPRFVWLAFAPALGFCGLDAYYVHQERRFRQLYNWVRQGMAGLSHEQLREVGPFCLDADQVPDRETRLLVNAWKALLSPAVWPFHGLILIGALFVALSVR